MPNTSYKEALLKLPPEVVLAAFSDGMLEILPHKNLAEKLAFLRTLFCHLDVTVEGAHAALHLDDKDSLPDDVALLLVKRGGKHGRLDDGTGLLRSAS
jgi:serine phosphatase RsbU (regulator of sigma subunit)